MTAQYHLCLQHTDVEVGTRTVQYTHMVVEVCVEASQSPTVEPSPYCPLQLYHIRFAQPQSLAVACVCASSLDHLPP